MAKKKQNVQNQLLQVVRTPVFKQRIVEDKTKYKRRNKHKGKGYTLSGLLGRLFNV